MQTISTNVNQAISDFKNIRDKIVECGVEVADGTPTSEYARKVNDVFEKGKAQGGGGDPIEAFLDIYLEGGNRQRICYAFAGDCWTEEMLRKIKYVMKPVETSTTNRYAQGVFYRLNRNGKELFDMTEVCKKFDFSECLDVSNLFDNAKVKNVTVNASKSRTLSRAFGAGDNGEINNVTLTVTEACTNFYQTFYYQSKMTKLRITEGSVIAANFDIQRSVLLDAESYDSVVRALSTTVTGNTISLPAYQTVVSVFDAKYGEGSWDIIAASKSNWTFAYA